MSVFTDALPRPSWATDRSVELYPDGTAMATFTARFGDALLSCTAARSRPGAPWELDDETELVLVIEAATSPAALRALASDLRRAAAALEGGTQERPLRRLPGATDHLRDLEG